MQGVRLDKVRCKNININLNNNNEFTILNTFNNELLIDETNTNKRSIRFQVYRHAMSNIITSDNNQPKKITMMVLLTSVNH